MLTPQCNVCNVSSSKAESRSDVGEKVGPPPVTQKSHRVPKACIPTEAGKVSVLADHQGWRSLVLQRTRAATLHHLVVALHV